MPSSFTIGSAFGIRIRVHVLFLLMALLLWSAFGPKALALLVMLFGIVLLHELGHSLVAQRFGIRVLDITFWPLGGMARMSHIPESTRIEGLIAIAGPAVNFALALPLLPWWNPGGERLLDWFILTNLGLGIFNLIPAFPMDGGRVLRALLGARGDWVGATEKAVHIGRVVAVFLGVVGPFFGFWLMPIIALWLWFVGGQELAAVRLRHAQDPFPGLNDLVRRVFGAAGAPRDPRAREDWSSSAFGGAPFPPRPGGPAAAADDRDRPQDADPARRPSAEPPADAADAARGISDEDVARLERFRGPLRQFRRE